MNSLNRKLAALSVFVASSWLGLGAPSAAQFQDGFLYITNWTGHIQEVDPSAWTATLWADNNDGLQNPTSAVFTPQGELLTANFATSEILRFDSNGNGSVILDSGDGIDQPDGREGLVFDPAHNLYILNNGPDEILMVAAGSSTPVVLVDAADGLNNPFALCIAGKGDLLVANFNSKEILAVDAAGQVALFDTLPNHPTAMVVRNNGDVYVFGFGGELWRFLGGDPAQRVLFTQFAAPVGPPVMQFDLDHSHLYIAGVVAGNLIEMDPDSAGWVEVLAPGTLFGGPTGIAFSGPECGPRFRPYGLGVPGTGGVMPGLTASGNAAPGGTFTIHVRDFVGGAPSLLMVATAPAHLPGFGGIVHVDPASAGFLLVLLGLPGAPGVPGAGDLDLSNTIPIPTLVACTHLYLQHFALDAGSPSGISMTAGLDVLFGR